MGDVGSTVLTYEVRDKETGKKVTVKVSEQDLMERYGEKITPSRIFVKDLACRRGLHEWKRYEKLVPRRIIK
jgi:hypothetical protein